ncbi:DUF4431 domain-containing protein [Serratia sp. DD3]|uniref:DUF4431 domain-containing protein n=1 Tax=Serratia sp. DD3 TaxID=1410619 RepID=UPI000427A741|nr:DUF4431 domain-containing protein [Serratia sp. DD3]
MEPLKKDDYTRQSIAQDLRKELNLADTLFYIKQISSKGDVAYFCGLLKDQSNHFLAGKNNQYHVYDRILIRTDKGWISAVNLDSDVAAPEQAHCFYDNGTVLQRQTVQNKVEAQGRKNICQPVYKDDPLRTQILDGLRDSYIGDSNTLTLNTSSPAVKFVVTELCASENYARFFGKASGDTPSPYRAGRGYFDVILQKTDKGTWRTVPENMVLTQQSTVHWSLHNHWILDGYLADTANNLRQRCVQAGDTLRLSGLLREQGTGGDAYWVIALDQPLACVRDADVAQPDWNTQMQLMLSAEERAAFTALLGKKVVAGGDISLALSSAHHTPLVLNNIFRITAQ